MDTDMDDVSQTDHAPNRINNNGFTFDFQRRLPSPPNEHDEGDFAAFSSDAFAPIYANDMGSQKSDEGKSSDRWSAFKTKPRDRTDDPGDTPSATLRLAWLIGCHHLIMKVRHVSLHPHSMFQ